MRIKVVFPEPDGPTSAAIVPRGTEKVALSTIRADAPLIVTAESGDLFFAMRLILYLYRYHSERGE